MGIGSSSGRVRDIQRRAAGFEQHVSGHDQWIETDERKVHWNDDKFAGKAGHDQWAVGNRVWWWFGAQRKDEPAFLYCRSQRHERKFRGDQPTQVEQVRGLDRGRLRRRPFVLAEKLCCQFTVKLVGLLAVPPGVTTWILDRKS